MAGMPENGKEGEALDMILTHIDSLHKRMDAMEAKNRKDGEETAEEKKAREDKARKDGNMGVDDAEEKERKDAEEKAKKDAEEKAKKDAEEKEFPRKDGESDEEYEGRKKEDSAKKDAAKKDAEEKERKDGKEKAKMDAARNDSVAALHKELAEIKTRLPVDMPEADRQQYVDAQVKADSVAQMFGTIAPRWQHGETLLQYRRRMLRKFQEHSPAWKSVDISKINDSAALDNIEGQIYADAVAAAKNPVPGGKDELRAVTTTDSAGRRITRLYGNNSITWAPFQPAVVRNVVGFYREPNRS